MKGLVCWSSPSASALRIDLHIYQVCHHCALTLPLYAEQEMSEIFRLECEGEGRDAVPTT